MESLRKHCLNLRVTSAERLSDRHVLLKLSADSALPPMRPGQFVEVRVDNSPATFLRRPISIHFVDRSANELWLLVAAIGEATRHLYHLKAGDELNCILPLGNGFSPAIHYQAHRILLVGGGVGVAPLLWQGWNLKQEGAQPEFLLGAKTASELLELDRFQSIGPVHVTTEDGSAGAKGFVTQHPVLHKFHFDLIQTCGPKPMMKAVSDYARATHTPCEASLENLMACGLGACLCCVEKTTTGNACVCKEGPVFNINKLLW